MDEQTSRIIRTAQDNRCKGVIEEPRIFYDEIEIPEDGTTGFGRSDAFVNGEQYPIKIHWMTCALGYLDAAGEILTNEELIQRVRLRFTYHGSNYMRRDFVRAPVWHNTPIAAPDAVAFGQAVLRPAAGWLLSSRDSLRVAVQSDDPSAGETPRTATVAITGYGLDTRRPYFKSSELALADADGHILNPADFRNDGDEPMVVTELAAHMSAAEGSQSPQGDIRALRLGVRQVGNGTEADWVISPPGLPETCPAVLFGTQSGRAIVHRWPPSQPDASPGLFWEPGEGLQVEVEGPAAGLTGGSPAILSIALVGSLVVA